ncbi:MAG: diacylglycerol kinase family protein [Myxococcota bacterium]
MNVLLVGNPTAQSGKNKERVEAALDELLARGVDAALVTTEPEGRTIPKVKAAIEAGSAERVIAMGGDGTFREVAAAIVTASRPVTMGFLPAGTANDQGKSFGIPAGPHQLERNIGTALGGSVRRIDGAWILALDDSGREIRRDLFFDSAGFGMQPAILVGRNRDREWVAKVPLLGSVYRDQAVYVGATVREALRSYVEPASFVAEVRGDGVLHRLDGLTDLVIKGTAIYGGMWVPARHSAPDDGVFDVIPLRGRTDMLAKLVRDWKDLPVGPDAVDWLGLTYDGGFSASRIEVELIHTHPVPAQIDGEEWAAGNHYRIEVLRQCLALAVPRDWSPPWD